MNITNIKDKKLAFAWIGLDGKHKWSEFSFAEAMFLLMRLGTELVWQNQQGN